MCGVCGVCGVCNACVRGGGEEESVIALTNATELMNSGMANHTSRREPCSTLSRSGAEGEGRGGGMER